MRTKGFFIIIATTILACAGSYAMSSAQTLGNDLQNKGAYPQSTVDNAARNKTGYSNMVSVLQAQGESQININRHMVKDINQERVNLTLSLQGQDLTSPSKPLIYKFESPDDYNVLFGVKPRPKHSYIHQNIAFNDGIPKTRYIAPVKLTAGIVISRKF